MENLGFYIKGAVATFAAAFSWLYGGFPQTLTVLLILVVADYLSGIAASAIEGKLSSKVGYVGCIKKIGIFLIIVLAHQLDTVIFPGTDQLRDIAIFFYMANELVSLTENAGRLGFPLPASITRAVEILKSKGGDDNDKKSDS